MHIITYLVSLEAVDAEKQFLKDNGIFPAEERTYTWERATKQGIWKIRLGAIVDDGTLLTLKLRKELESVTPYVQGKKISR